MGKITTHVLDTAHGRPGKDIDIAVYRVSATGYERITSARTNDDGRVDSPLVDDNDLVAGKYELVFSVGDYFRRTGLTSDQPFLDDVVIRFQVQQPAEHYHVPLLISPWSYTTYRGS